MRLAYADPPYLGCCAKYGHRHEAPWGCWDDPAEHERLMIYLDRNYDGWAYSLTSTSLDDLVPLRPAGVRTGAWIKSFAAYKTNVRIAYAWEPIFWCPGRDSSRDGAPVGRDFVICPITLRRGLTGAKPAEVCRAILDWMGYVDGDTVDDLFPGTGIMSLVKAQGVLSPVAGD